MADYSFLPVDYTPDFSLVPVDHDPFAPAPRFSDFRRSDNVEDRRDEVLPLGPFGTPGLPPSIFEGDSTLASSGLNASKDFAPNSRTQLGVDLGTDTLESTLLKQQQDNEVRDALDNASVAIPGDDDPNGPPVRVNNRVNANPVPFGSSFQ